MKRSEIGVGDDLAYGRSKYSSPVRVRVVAVDGYHLKPRDTMYYSRLDRRPEPLELPDGSTLSHGRVRLAGPHYPVNCVIVREVAEDGTLRNPEPVRTQTLLGQWAEVKAWLDAERTAKAQHARETARRKAKNLAQGKDLLARLAALGIEPRGYISEHNLAAGKIELYLDDLAQVVDLIPKES